MLSGFGECKKCDTFLSNCQECRYDNNNNNNNNNNNQPICAKCDDGYYPDSDGKCKNCYYKSISGGECYVCSINKTEYDRCWCWGGYVKIGHSECFSCPSGCAECSYDNKTGTTECLSCYSNHVFNSDKECIYCGEHCSSCKLDKDNNTICLSCYSDSVLDNDKCLFCQYGCSNCTINPNSVYKNETVCSKCDYDYAFNPENNNCTYCSSIEQFGGEYGCERCLYNEASKNYECLECWNENYTYINNTYQCFENINSSRLYFYGCLKAQYIKESGTYECFECKDDFILIKNDKTCRKLNEIDLSEGCLEVINLGTVEEPLYSCEQCLNNYTKVIINSNNNKSNCYKREDDFWYCLEGLIEENGAHKCTKCVELASLNSSNQCECNSDSFGKNYSWCYKCDDINNGNIGCNAEKRCEYIHSNNELDCNECKSGYFNYTKGQCFSCENEIPNCNLCHYDSNKRKLQCDKCSTIYAINDEKDKCELNECKEYPEISSGCIICNDKLNEYLPNKKCQTCKYGYFKTKDEKCIYCRSEKYGGPGCYECGYKLDENGDETDNIICKDCFSISNYYSYDYYYYYGDYYYTFDSVLNSEGKCYNHIMEENCIKYEFIKDKNNVETITCTLCSPGYYLSSENKCISFKDKINIIQNCQMHIFYIGDIEFYFYYYENSDFYINTYYNNRYSFYNSSIYKEALKNIKFPINTTCDYCKNGYFLNDKRECYFLEFEKCKINNLINSSYQQLYNCESLCNYNNYPLIYLKFENNSLDFNIDNYKYINSSYDIISIYNFIDYYRYSGLNKETLNLVGDLKLCYNISNEDLKNKFQNCKNVIYIPTNKSYICFECYYDYYLNYSNQTCLRKEDEYYHINNCSIDTNSPNYSCKNCYSSSETLVTFETRIKECINDDLLLGCKEATANSYYVNNIYNCTSCNNNNYWLYYSKFYQRQICQNVYEKVIKRKELEIEEFENENSIKADSNGICPDNYFTPDEENCYKCDNENIGMPGCDGKCNFSLKRNIYFE